MTDTQNNGFDRFALADRVRRAGLKQNAICQEARPPLNESLVSDWMRGKTENPDPELLRRYEDALSRLETQQK